MTRDYKPAQRARKTPASGSGSSLLVGILIGLLLGLAIALGVAVYLNKIPAPFTGRGKAPESPPSAKNDILKPPPAAPAKAADATPRPEDKPRFDFYQILPGDDAGKGKAAKEPPKPPGSDVKETFYLQAGAFQGAADADNMKARLALLGLEATIQVTTSAERGTFHRVRLGPYSRVEDVNRVREVLKQNDIETTLIKGRDANN